MFVLNRRKQLQEKTFAGVKAAGTCVNDGGITKLCRINRKITTHGKH